MRLLLSLSILSVLFSCSGGKENPDVSGIKINVSTYRFEKALFQSNSAAPDKELDATLSGNNSFGLFFLNTILNADPSWHQDTLKNYVAGFVYSHKNVFDTAEKIFADFTPYEQQIKKALQYLKYYFPGYAAPSEIITYIGPLDGYGDIITDDALVVALQHHLGKDASFYKQGWLQETYPNYITSKFEPEYIVVNCMKNIVNDMYPDDKIDAPLGLQMVEVGKRLFMMEKLMPDVDPFRIIGYSKEQLKGCYDHERAVWDLFIQNDLLQSIDKNIIKNYLGESPKTQELGESSPGNIGAFSGWQIVKKYMDKYPETKLNELMKMDPEKILQLAKYKP
jgi:hypothetical protein